MNWRCIGPILSGGTVFALAAHQGHSGTLSLYAGTGVGLFRSSDGGQGWSYLAAPAAARGIQALALSPQFLEDRTILAGGFAPGLLRSTDGGNTWMLHALGNSASPVTALSLSPEFAEDGIALAGTAEDGIFRSTDHGRSWQTANFGLLDLEILSLATAPDWSREEIAFAVTGTGLYRTPNGARAWRMVEGEIEDQPGLTVAVSPDFGRDQMALVGTEGAGVWRSQDRGLTWHQAGLDGQVVNCLACSAEYVRDRTLYAGTATGELWRSHDGGRTWRRVNHGMPTILSLAAAGPWVLAGTYQQGLYASRDRGDTWNWRGAGLAARSITLLHALDDSTLLAAGKDILGITPSMDAGASWQKSDPAISELHIMHLTSAEGSIALAASSKGVLRSLDRGRSWVLLSLPDGEGPASCVRPSLTFSQDHTVWAGTSGGQIFRSLDGGETWSTLPGALVGERIVALEAVGSHGTQTALLVGSLASGADGQALARLWRSHDLGNSWQLSLEQSVDTPWVALAPTPGGGCILGVGPHVLRSMDGRYWGERHLVIDELTRILSLGTIVGPQGKESLLAGTNRGLYASHDAGEHWEPAPEELVGRPIVALSTPPAHRSVYAMAAGGMLWHAVG